MFNIKIAGIYKIENTVTGYYYLGLSTSILDRWSSHYTNIKLNKHSSPLLTQHWNQTEPNQWTFSILEYISITEYKKTHQIKGKELTNSFRTHLLKREKYWMSLYSKNFALNKNNKHFS